MNVPEYTYDDFEHVVLETTTPNPGFKSTVLDAATDPAYKGIGDGSYIKSTSYEE